MGSFELKLIEFFRGYDAVAGGPYRVRAPQYQDANGPGELYGESAFKLSDLEKLSRSYYRGIDDLDDEDKEALIKDGVLSNKASLEENNNKLKNYLFRRHFEVVASESAELSDILKWKKEIWDNRSSLTKKQRDSYFALLAQKRDLDKRSDLQQNSLFDLHNLPGYIDHIDARTSGSVRRDAMDYLNKTTAERSTQIYSSLTSMPADKQELMLKLFDEISKQSLYYNYYKGTDKLKDSKEKNLMRLSLYLAMEEQAGSELANKALLESYLNEVANNQTLWEKTANMGAGFVDNFVGNVAFLVGMVYGAAKYGFLERQGFWESVIDNDVTNWANNLTATNAWTTEEQEKLLAMGMSDNAILNTVDLQNSIFNQNTLFEVGALAGFFVGSGFISKSISTAVKIGANLTFKAAKALGGGEKVARGIINTRNAAYIMTPAAAGTVEGGMNALHTKDTTLETLNQEITSRYDKLVSKDIENLSNALKYELLKRSKVDTKQIPEPSLGVSEDGHYTQQFGEELEKLLNYLIKNTPELKQLFLNKYLELMLEEYDKAEELANTAMLQDFVINSTINGIVNTTFLATLESAAVQKRLQKIGLGRTNNITNNVAISNNAGAWSALANKAKFIDYLKRKGREAFGEGLEEYSQDISSAFSQAYAKNSMLQYLDHKNRNTEGGEAIETDWVEATAAGIMAATKQATDFQTIKAGVYGALSTLGPRINNYRGEAKRAEDESGLAYLLRRSYVELGASNFAGELRSMNEKNLKIADNLNKFFSDKSVQDKLMNSSATASWMTSLQRALDNKDNKEARDNELGMLVSQVMTLNSLRGTAYYTTVMNSLQERANLDESKLLDNESKESKIVDQFIANNKGILMTREQAVEDIKKSANKLLLIKEQVEKATEEVDKSYGENFDGEVKESLVFNRLVIQDYKKRAKLLDEEIQSINSDVVSQSVAPTQLGNKSKSIIAKYGSIENAVSKLEKLRSQKEAYEKNIKELKKEKRLLTLKGIYSDKAKEANLILKFMLKNDQKEYQLIVDEIKLIEDGQEQYAITAPTEEVNGVVLAKKNTIISAAEIMQMNPEDRATMLNPKNEKLYSKELLEEIEKVRQAGVAKFLDFDLKVLDRGLLERDYKAAMQLQTLLLYDTSELSDYAALAKRTALKRSFKKQHESLLEESLNEDLLLFREHLNDIYSRGNRVEMEAVQELLKGNLPFKEYEEALSNMDSIMKELNNDRLFNSLEEATTFRYLLDYLHSKGVDPNNYEQAVLELTRVLEDSLGNEYSVLELYLKQMSENSQLSLLKAGEAIDLYKDIMSSYLKNKLDRENNSYVIEGEEGKGASNPPLDVSGPEVKKDDEDDHPLVKAAKESNNSEDIITIIEGLVKAISNWSEELVPELMKLDILANLELVVKEQYTSMEEFIGRLNAKANTIDTLDLDGDSKLADLIRKLVAVSNNIKSDILNKKAVQANIFKIIREREAARNRASGAANASLLASSDFNKILQNHPNSATAKFLREHRVIEFLQSNYLNENKDATVYFITDDDLNTLIALDMGDLYNDSFRSVIAVIEHPLGTIDIDGKNYQVIATMPTMDYFQGFNNTAKIRELSIGSASRLFIRDKKGTVLTTVATRVLTEHFSRGQEGEYNDAMQLIKNWLATKHPELSNIPIGSLNNSLKQAILRALFSRIATAKRKTKEGKEYSILQFRIDNLRGDETYQDILVRNWDQILGPNLVNGLYKTIYELFKEGHVEQALSSHYRIELAAQSLKKELLFNTLEFGFEEKDGKLVPDNNTKQAINSIIDSVEKALRRSISLAQGYYCNIDILEDANLGVVYSLSVTDGNTKIPLLTFDGVSEITDELVFEALKTLLVDLNGDSRKVDIGGRQFNLTKPLVDYPSGLELTEGEKAGLANALLSGTLGFNVSTLSYNPFLVMLKSPIDSLGLAITANQAPPKPKTKYANKDNASSAEEESEEAGNKLNQRPANNSEEVEKRMTEDASNILLNDKEDYYIDARTNETFIRATRLLESDEDYLGAKEEHRLKNGYPIRTKEEEKAYLEKWKVSTDIGNVVDDLLRKIFSEEITEDNVEQAIKLYPIAKEELLRRTIENAIETKNELKRKGWEVVLGDIRAFGTVKVLADNKFVEAKVAGTLDLLMKDANGHYHIIDFKTNRSLDGYKRVKYNKQLALYRDLLLQTYGIQVDSLLLFIIDVAYDSPKGTSKGSTAEYSIDESTDLILLDGKPFTLNSMSPGLLSVTYGFGHTPDIMVKPLFAQLSEEDQQVIMPSTQTSSELNILPESGTSELNSEEDNLNEDEDGNNEDLNDNSNELSIDEVVDIDLGMDDAFSIDDEFSLDMLKDATDLKNQVLQEVDLDSRVDIPFSLLWDNLRHFIINGKMIGEEKVKLIKEHFRKFNITKLVWNKLNNDTMEHMLTCAMG